MAPYPPSAATDPSLPHDSLDRQIIGICSAMMVLVTLVVGTRFWIRWSLIKGPFGADDYCILIAWILAMAFDLDPINQTKFGLGRHIYDLSPETNFSASLELYYFGEILYYLCVAVTKVAILFLYLRLAVKPGFRRLVWASMVFVIVTTFAFVTASVFQCRPIHKAWDAAGKVPGSCFNVNALFFANAGLDIFQDAFIYVLPMKMLYDVQIPRRQKIALMIVFAIGGFVVITGMVRLNSLKVAQSTSDPSYDNFGAAVWSAIESNIGIVCASLPHFKPLIDRFYPSLMGPGRGNSQMTPLHDQSKGSMPSEGKDNTLTSLQQEGQTGWKDSFAGDKNSNNQSCTTVTGGKLSNGNEENLRGGEIRHPPGRIYKSTSVVVSRH